jgi:hypothetical protein
MFLNKNNKTEKHKKCRLLAPFFYSMATINVSIQKLFIKEIISNAAAACFVFLGFIIFFVFYFLF